MGNFCSNNEPYGDIGTADQGATKQMNSDETFDREIMTDSKDSLEIKSMASWSTASSPVKMCCFQHSFIEMTDPGATCVRAKDVTYNTWPKGIPESEAGTLWKVMFCQKGAENGYKVGMGVWILKKGRVLDIHAHQLAEIYVILGGSSITEIDGQCVKTKPGQVYMLPPDADHVSMGGPEEDLYGIFMYPWHAFDDSVYDLYENKRPPIEPSPDDTEHKDLLDCNEKWAISNYHPEEGLRRFLMTELAPGETREFSPNEQVIHLFIWLGEGRVSSGMESWEVEPSTGLALHPGTHKVVKNTGLDPMSIFLVALNYQALV